MGIKERRLAEREQTKMKIFNAAIDIIIAEGYENLSIRKIAEKIEYSPGVIYNYFKDKNEIVRLIIAEHMHKICESIYSMGLLEKEPRVALEQGLTKFAASMLENRQQYKAIMLSGLNLSMFSEIDLETGKLNELLIHVLNTGKKTGVFVVENEEMTSMLLISAIFGLINTIVQENLTDEHMQFTLIKSYVDILVRGVSR